MTDERRTLYTGFLEELVKGVSYTTPDASIAKQGKSGLPEELHAKRYQFVIIGGFDEPINAHIRLESGLEADVYLFKLFGSKDDNGKTLKENFNYWAENRVFMTPEELVIQTADEKNNPLDINLGSRPYRIREACYEDMPSFMGIDFLDGKKPNSFDVLHYLLFRSEELEPEKAAEILEKRAGK
jgi:hypothetical protein